MTPRATIAELLAFILVWVLVFSFIPGCGSKPPVASSAPDAAASVAEEVSSTAVKEAAPGEEDSTQTKSQPIDRDETGLASEQEVLPEGQAAERKKESASVPQATFVAHPLRKVNEQTIDAAGLHKVTGKHLTFYTDLPVDAEIAELPKVFDQAFAGWCNTFSLDPKKYEAWQMRGTLIGDKDRFEQTDLIPAGLPPFRNGYARAGELWLYEQPSAYYRRHLLLHEGTHGFMDMLLGGSGPPWYMEGMAELLATHTWQEGKLTLNVMPDAKENFEMLGRIKIVQEGTPNADGPKSLPEILNYSSRAHLENEPYGWCWALAAFLDKHPKYQTRFRELQTQVTDHEFNKHFVQSFQPDWQALNTEWQLFAGTLEHGHDLQQTSIDFVPSTALTTGSAEVKVEAKRGWQSTGVQLIAGQKYKLTATGQFQIAMTDQPWISEAGGVTIRYYQGNPVGMLLAAVVDLNQMSVDGTTRTPFLSPVAIGLSGELTPEQDGTLFLQVNDSAGERFDNSGSLSVAIAAE